MPRIRETLLQVKERQRRELRLRTEARCAQLVAGSTRTITRDGALQSSRDHRRRRQSKYRTARQRPTGFEGVDSLH